MIPGLRGAFAAPLSLYRSIPEGQEKGMLTGKIYCESYIEGK
jgi:hypothetical protein